METSRRSFLGTLAVGAVAAATKKGGGKDEEVTPGEDLMREHGVLRRVMFAYDQMAARLEHGETIDLKPLNEAAGMVRHFIEDYHEKLEENFIFPRFRKAKRLVQLVDTLETQHRAGRKVTERIRTLTGKQLGTDERVQLLSSLRSFNEMYRPHAAREDTVLFPALRELVGAHAYAELGERFEDREHEVLGKAGFEGAVKQIAQIEQALGIADLAQFTPKE